MATQTTTEPDVVLVGAGIMSATLGTLSAKTVYYFRPVVSTVGGISYGAVQSFKTN